MRFLLSKTVQKFRGIAQYPPINTVTMDWALDIRNVIVNKMGWLSKIRVPTKLLPAASTSPIRNLFFYSRSLGSKRQLIMAALRNPLFANNPYLSYIDTSNYPIAPIAPVAIGDPAANLAPFWDAAESNNILYMANGQVMKKWLGEPMPIGIGQPLTDWQVPRPPAPTIGWKCSISSISRVGNVVSIALGFPTRRNVFTFTSDGSPFHAWTFKQANIPAHSGDQGYDTLKIVSGVHPDLNGVYYFVGDPVNPSNTLQCRNQFTGSDYAPVADPTGYVVIYTSSFNGAGSTANGEYPGGLGRTNNIGRLYFQGGLVNAPDMWFDVGELVTISGSANPYASFIGTWRVLGFAQDGHGWYASIDNPGPDFPTSYGGAISDFGTIHGGLTFNAAAGSFYLYGCTYKCSITGAEGALSPLLSVPVDMCASFKDQRLLLTLPFPPNTDPQVDTICWYRNQLGDGTLYLQGEYSRLDHGELVLADGSAYLNDGKMDEALNTAITAPLLNYPPPVGKYLTVGQGRVFISGVEDDPNTVSYSAYETVLRGRPETCFYPNNKIRLATGAKEVAGHGLLQSGLVIWTVSDQMFILRGALSDVTLSNPVAFSEQLEELPFKTGLMSHYTVKGTDRGSLIWVDRSMDVRSWNDNGQAPLVLSTFITPFMKNINKQCWPYLRGTYINWQERDWYVLSAADNSYTASDKGLFNWAVFFDTDPDEVANTGIFLMNIEHDCLEVVEDADSEKFLVLSQGGSLFNIQLSSNTVHGLTTLGPNRGQTDATFPAYYLTGFYGSDSPQVKKMFRFGGLVADANPVPPNDPGFQLTAYMVDDESSSFLDPAVFPILQKFAAGGGRFSVNRKSRRCAIKIDFPITDMDCNVIELRLSYKPISER